jgi:putative membrane protein
MTNFKENIKENIVQAVREIESKSSAEIVAIIKKRSGNYTDLALWAGFVLMFVVYSFFMFSPDEYDSYLIYILSLISFFVGYAAVQIFNPLTFLLAKKKRLAHNAELYARAVFQKGGIRHTIGKTGVLFYLSLFEKQVVVLADRGAQTCIPAEEWDKINESFREIFKTKKPETQFIEILKNSAPVFGKYLPIQPDDINELPDDLNIEI